MDDITMSKKLVKQVLVRLSSLGKLTSRSMFGGYGICYEGAMFALVSDAKFYLRAGENLEKEFVELGLEQFVYKNRGVPVPMSYYLINYSLWNDKTMLLELANKSMEAAIEERKYKSENKYGRLKDLPNMKLSIERLLSKVGIKDKEMLVQYGALEAYLMIKDKYRHTNINILFALAGAIEGCHVAVLTKSKKEQLLADLAARNAKKKETSSTSTTVSKH